MLTTAITDGPFDVIVLDEAQDLSDMWMLALDDLLAPGGRWYAFADRHQDIFASQVSLKDFLQLEHELRENFRNTSHIAEFRGAVRTDGARLHEPRRSTGAVRRRRKR